MSRKRVVILCSAVVLVATCGLLGWGVSWLVGTLTICNTGSPELAREWATALENLPDVEAAREADERIWGKRFADGQWLFGLSQDSHGSPRMGGTVVVNDSRSGVRVFFGHVCGGPGPLWWKVNFERGTSLDEFYAGLAQRGFTEHALRAK